MNVYLIGAKNPETKRQVAAAERADRDFRVVGFLDNDSAKHGRAFVGRPVVGGVEAVPEIVRKDPEARFVNLITGSTLARYEVSCDVARLGGTFTNLIHPDVDLTDVEVGVGLYVQDGVIIHGGSRIGSNSSIHMGALVGHEATVGSSVFIGVGCGISGEVTIHDGAFLGTHTTVLPRLTIGPWTLVGAGSVVTKEVAAGATVAGNPARVLRVGDALPTTGDPSSS